MKRFVGFAAVAAMLLAIPLSHLATARGRPDKITICHFDDDSDDEEPTAGLPQQGPTGIVLRVAERAWAAHEAHGDCKLGDGLPITARPTSCDCNGDGDS